jgi:hypothetical protein
MAHTRDLRWLCKALTLDTTPRRSRARRFSQQVSRVTSTAFLRQPGLCTQRWTTRSHTGAADADHCLATASAMHHSANLRSAVAAGNTRVIDDPAGKARALHCLLDHIAPGRAADCRTPNARELATTGCSPPTSSMSRPRCATGARLTIRQTGRCGAGPASCR